MTLYTYSCLVRAPDTPARIPDHPLSLHNRRCVYLERVGVVQPLSASSCGVFLQVLQLWLFQQKSWAKNAHGDTSGIADAAQQLPPKISGGRMPVSLSSIFFGRRASPQHVLGSLCLPSKL